MVKVQITTVTSTGNVTLPSGPLDVKVDGGAVSIPAAGSWVGEGRTAASLQALVDVPVRGLPGAIFECSATATLAG
ncbi:MAG: hypothetical protein ACK5O2_17255 [Microthrixaceae bacterium]